MIPLGRLLGAAWKIHFALPVLCAAALLLGKGGALFCALAALFAHECGHALAARVCGCSISSVELTPFGGVAAYDGSDLRPAQEAAVALAGPAASLLCAGICGASGLRQLLLMNMALFAVNLLPVLPLDGGRALRAVLFPRRARGKITAALSFAGAAAGAGLCGLGVLAAAKGSLNPTLFLCGAYLMRQALRERETPALLSARALHGRADKMRRAGVRPVRWLAAEEGTPPSCIAARFTGGEYCMVVMVDKNMRVKRLACETEFLETQLW